MASNLLRMIKPICLLLWCRTAGGIFFLIAGILLAEGPSPEPELIHKKSNIKAFVGYIIREDFPMARSNFVVAILESESDMMHFKGSNIVIGKSNEIGIGQVMPDSNLGDYDLYDLMGNIMACIHLVHHLAGRYKGDFVKVAEAYNKGPVGRRRPENRKALDDYLEKIKKNGGLPQDPMN